MSYHFQNVKGFMSVVVPFSEKHNCKQKFVNKILCTVTSNSFTDKVVLKNNKIYTKLLNLFQLSRIYNLLYPPVKAEAAAACWAAMAIRAC